MKTFSEHINEYRIRAGALGSDDSYGMVGAFHIPLPCGLKAFVVSSDGMGWEHVSVSTGERCLTWDEMCFIKDLFWNDDEAVMQLHPPKKDYVRNHPYCLHLWKPLRENIPLPPTILVGAK
jgi:hypothetical protein